MPERVLVSACLLGVGCRYDGKEKANESVCALLKDPDVMLIPVCPEQLGGLATPRIPSEQRDSRVVNQDQQDVTIFYQKGARETLKLARLYGCQKAILKERSPSCGCGFIYDGSFTKTLVPGNGVTAELLQKHGIQVLGESTIKEGQKRL